MQKQGTSEAGVPIGVQSGAANSDVEKGLWVWILQHTTLVVALIAVAALLLRIVRLGVTSLWVDEIWSMAISGLPLHGLFWTIAHLDPNMSVYYLFLHLWMQLTQSAAGVRAISVVFGAATIPAVYALGVRLFDKKVALVASLLLAVNAFHIQWSQETRSYGLLVLLLTLSALFLVKAVENPTAKNCGAYAVLSTLAMYAHVYAALVLIAQAISLLFVRREEVPWRRLLVTAGAIGVLNVPLAVLIVVRALHPWLPLGWMPTPSIHNFYDKFYSLAGNADFPGSYGGKTLLAGYTIASAVAVGGWLSQWRRSGRGLAAWGVPFAALWLLVPIVLAFATAVIQPMLMSRYFLMCVPGLVFLAAKGLCSIRPAALRTAAVLALVALCVQRLPQYYEHRVEFREWENVTEHVVKEAETGDGVVFCIAPGRLLFDYYQQKDFASEFNKATLIYPPPRDSKTDPLALDYLPSFNESNLRSLNTRYRRVWFVVYHDFYPKTREARDAIENILSQEYHHLEKVTIDGVTVMLYS